MIYFSALFSRLSPPLTPLPPLSKQLSLSPYLSSSLSHPQFLSLPFSVTYHDISFIENERHIIPWGYHTRLKQEENLFSDPLSTRPSLLTFLSLITFSLSSFSLSLSLYFLSPSLCSDLYLFLYLSISLSLSSELRDQYNRVRATQGEQTHKKPTKMDSSSSFFIPFHPHPFLPFSHFQAPSTKHECNYLCEEFDLGNMLRIAI